jgi:hypothetical protein
MNTKTSTFNSNNPENVLARISPSGDLVLFNNMEIRKVAKEDPFSEGGMTARLCIALLDRVAREVDHIYKEGGGTYGDAIRNLNIK